MKKGPWSPEEDAKLKEFIEKYGTGGNWIALPHKAGRLKMILFEGLSFFFFFFLGFFRSFCFPVSNLERVGLSQV